MTCKNCDDLLKDKKLGVGIDPTLTATGLTVFSIDDHCVVETATIRTTKPKGQRDSVGVVQRIRQINNKIDAILSKYPQKNITLVGMESPSLRGSGRVLQLGGVFFGILEHMGITYGDEVVYDLPPNTIKFLTTGKGRAEKEEVEAGLNKLGIDTSMAKNYDETDAIGAIYSALLIADYASGNECFDLTAKQISAVRKALYL
jgi:Holliday junction resolvasome RuvABC endonuclease subunit